MGAVETITITLSAEMAAAVKETVAEGQYAFRE